jgi:hypothetical protein
LGYGISISSCRDRCLIDSLVRIAELNDLGGVLLLGCRGAHCCLLTASVATVMMVAFMLLPRFAKSIDRTMRRAAQRLRRRHSCHLAANRCLA